MLVREVLIENGYAPLEAGDGPSALEILRSSVRIDLFITGYAQNAAIGNRLLER